MDWKALKKSGRRHYPDGMPRKRLAIIDMDSAMDKLEREEEEEAVFLAEWPYQAPKMKFQALGIAMSNARPDHRL